MQSDQRGPELTAEQLRKVADVDSFGFETTAGLEPAPHMVGQERAVEAIEFGLEIDDPRYNLYISGDPGTGRQTAALAMVSQVASERLPRFDWCYVYNFEQPAEPRALALPSGRARRFARDIDGFVLASRRELRRAFTDDLYTKRRDDLLRAVDTQHTALLEQLQQEALALGFLLQGTPAGLQILPRKVLTGVATESPGSQISEREPSPPSIESRPMTRDEFEALSKDEQQQLQANQELVQAAVNRMLPLIRTLEEEARAKVRRLDHEIARTAIEHLSESLQADYAAIQSAGDYLRALTQDVIAHADVLGKPAEDSTADPGTGPDLDTLTIPGEDEDTPKEQSLGVQENPDADSGQGSGVPLDEDLRVRPNLAALLRRYKVNVVTFHRNGDHAPVVQETNPTYSNLMGRIEYGTRDGLPYTDHLMIRPGALHRANGGFLILQATDVLGQARSWDAVKRMLRFGSIASESISESQGPPPSGSLRPQPIPAEIKVVLIGDTETYSLLMSRDAEFHHLFKVRADFDSEMPRDARAEHFYATFAGDVARRSKSPPLTARAVAALVEEGSRWIEDQEKLSTQLGSLSDLTVEACYWAKKDDSPVTGRLHVDKAIESRQRRLGQISDKIDQLIYQGTTMIDTSQVVLGQVNGLTVLRQGDHSFGKPVRITARTSPGWAGVVDLEREIGESGPSHSKGVLILSGYLAGRFSQEYPLSLAASLCFEQLYDEVDGDSASSAELYAMLSCLAGVGIKQSLAVTGSVNQRGKIQAVGGVTHKIESFFRICNQRGLTRDQGVIIPEANIRNLMLRNEVVEAVRAGQFHVHAISTIDDGIELLTGIPAGKPDPTGRYLEGTINARVTSTLRTYGERVQAFGLPAQVTRYRSGNKNEGRTEQS
jgi:predicted ATP-dependent protease